MSQPDDPQKTLSWKPGDPRDPSRATPPRPEQEISTVTLADGTTPLPPMAVRET